MDYKSESKGERGRTSLLLSLSHFASDVGCRVPLGHGGEGGRRLNEGAEEMGGLTGGQAERGRH